MPLLEDPNDVAIAMRDVDSFGSLPESHAIVNVTRYDGVSQQFEASLGVGPEMEVSTAFTLKPIIPLSETL